MTTSHLGVGALVGKVPLFWLCITFNKYFKLYCTIDKYALLDRVLLPIQD